MMSQFLMIPFNVLLSLLSFNCIHSCENPVFILIYICQSNMESVTVLEALTWIEQNSFVKIIFLVRLLFFFYKVIHYFNWIVVPFSELMYWIHYKKYRELKERVEEKPKFLVFMIIIDTHSFTFTKVECTVGSFDIDESFLC